MVKLIVSFLSARSNQGKYEATGIDSRWVSSTASWDPFALQIPSATTVPILSLPQSISNLVKSQLRPEICLETNLERLAPTTEPSAWILGSPRYSLLTEIVQPLAEPQLPVDDQFDELP